MLKKIAFILGLSLLQAAAHPSPAHQLNEIEKHLAKDPDDPALLRLQANLLLERRPKQAAKVIDGLIAKDPENPENRLLQARLDAVTGKPDQAREALAALVKTHPELDQAWAILSDLQEGAGQRDEAISSSIEALQRSSSPSASRILTAVGWLHQRGKTGDAETAVRLIDRGLSLLGCLTGLHEAGIRIELETGKYDSALRRIDAMEARYRPTVAFALRRADILEKAGRPAKAADACDAALALLDLSAPSRKKTAEFQEQWDAVTKRKADNLAKASAE